MKTLVFCLEEPSAQEMLKGLLPRILPPEITTRYIVFQGKQDMERQLVRRLRLWQAPDTLFVVMRDQDAADCKAVKEKLVALCRKAGKGNALVRVACRELESFYLGDLRAVEKGLAMSGLAARQNSRKFREPDRLATPAQELNRLTGNGYQKIAGSRTIAPHLRLEGNRSHSFSVLVEGIKKIVEPEK
jgi:hypothetical protein